VQVVLIGLFGTACGLLAANDHHPFLGYFCVIFFGIGSIAYAARLAARRNYLEISKEGLTMPSFFRSSFLPWDHVQNFYVVAVMDTKLIGWNYIPNFTGRVALRRLNTFLVGAEGTLSSYGMPADELAALLNRVRERYSDLRFPAKS